jgi:hypothetical protein
MARPPAASRLLRGDPGTAPVPSPGWDAAFAGGRYNFAMPDVVHFHGTYRYATREGLERAVSSAREVIAEEDAAEIDAAWMRCFVTRGTVLTVNLTSRIDRFSAAAVFDTLARSAIEGAVEARLGDTHVDLFSSGEDT